MSVKAVPKVPARKGHPCGMRIAGRSGTLKLGIDRVEEFKGLGL